MAEELIRIYPNDGLSFNIDNLTDEDLQDIIDFDLKLEKEGKPVSEETFEIEVEPHHNYWYFLQPGDDLENGEYIYNIDGKLKKAYNGLKKGTKLAHAQKIFNVNDKEVPPKENNISDLKVTETDHDILFEGKDFTADFSKPLGGLVSLNYDGVDYLDSKPLITFWRPLTDTDLHLGYNFDSALWLAATIGQQLLPEKFYFEHLEDSYKLTFVYRYPIPGGQENAVTYQVFPDGTINIESIYSGLATVDTMPVFGIDFKLNKNCDSFRYYGYGPDENYIDTTEGLDLGVFETTVRKNFNKKIRPQESGNRTGVRWAEVYNAKTGKGIKFTALKEPFEFNALPYNTYEIEAASDASELSKISHTNVRIAGKVSGVGNGDQIADWARIDAGEMIDLDFSISPVSLKKDEPKKVEKKTSKATENKEEKKVAPKEEQNDTKKVTPKKEAVKKEETSKTKTAKSSKSTDKVQKET